MSRVWSYSLRSLSRLERRFWRATLASLVGISLLLLPVVPALAEEPTTPPPFGFSGFAAEGRQHSPAASPPKSAGIFPTAKVAPGTLAVGSNVNIIGNADVTMLATINGNTVFTCSPGMQTAQNETTIAVNPANANNLVAGANDYRLYEPSENRYDGSGGFYRSNNGGKTWSAGFLPGLVRPNGGAYESAGDPAVAAGPNDTFWYANLVFNRTDDASGVAVSRSTDGGRTWTTHFVYQTSAADGATLFNDKEWIAADPNNANVAYVTWTQFFSNSGGISTSAQIVLSKTTDGGNTWSAPTVVSPYRYNQGSVVMVDSAGRVHVVYEAYVQPNDMVAYSFSNNGGASFQTKTLAVVSDIPDPLPGSTYRTNSFPAFVLDGANLHVVWSNWNGTNADVAYVHSADNGANWSSPATIAGGPGDEFFPWVGASGGKVYASYFNRTGGGNPYGITAVGSANNGGSWSSPVAVSSAVSNPNTGNAFGYPNCDYSFVGDYSGVTVGSDGVAHVMWTDIRSSNPDQDAYTATLKQ